ncbi:MAG: hypothetical protein HOH33_12555 [Verrucomicrobia bacterium]|jgi:hypothetical protein|nr:hypothetical protein [Verrucomicrobiota bacterium]
MKLAIYQLMHVGSMVALTAFIFMAFANPDPKGKKRTMMITGILSLLMFIGGFGMISVLKIGFPAWVWIKLICWFGVSGMAGMAYRKPESANKFKAITLAALIIAIFTVYFRHQF